MESFRQTGPFMAPWSTFIFKSVCYFYTHTHTHTHTHTLVFYGLRGLSIGVMVFILYKLYVPLPYTYPTPKLSPHRRWCISTFPPKNLLCMIYKHFKLWGHWKCPYKSPSPCNTHVIIQICVLINMHTHTHTQTQIQKQTHTHTHTHTHNHNYLVTLYHTISIVNIT